MRARTALGRTPFVGEGAIDVDPADVVFVERSVVVVVHLVAGDHPVAVGVQAVALLEEFRLFPTAYTDYPLILSAIEHSLRYGISYWDGAIVAAAEALEAPVLYTEDLSHDQQYGTVRAVNPFLEV